MSDAAAATPRPTATDGAPPTPAAAPRRVAPVRIGARLSQTTPRPPTRHVAAGFLDDDAEDADAAAAAAAAAAGPRGRGPSSGPAPPSKRLKRATSAAAFLAPTPPATTASLARASRPAAAIAPIPPPPPPPPPSSSPSAAAPAAVSILQRGAVPGLRALPDDTARYRHDLQSRPATTPMADYAAVPVAEFGIALLRGMGWTPPAGAAAPAASAPPRAVVARPPRLGIGASLAPPPPPPPPRAVVTTPPTAAAAAAASAPRPAATSPAPSRAAPHGSDAPPASRRQASRDGRAADRPRGSSPPSASVSTAVPPDGTRVRITRGRYRDRRGRVVGPGTRHADGWAVKVQCEGDPADGLVKVWADQVHPL
ncbi:hypothetical protein CXG81DRAFT_20780 [Caulochytrium protostelioides]|uniref:Spp2/MOS2 G-patch domain-containing protein n=1 Tax=Caulochytrium protostelioides TaxID=1555241 RepID=A0A4V1IU26_9FUNG|nr:hypothetical protein CXG81DRAFT_20780 [Caulochytrium protostelioides]|eukprot:RKO99087.1 hypothetical protein CXG81DRAFT_20780 [Caulochytrium protostelioides]